MAQSQLQSSSTSLALVLLAAGKGTRMKSDTPKVLFPLLGQSIISYIVQAALGLEEKAKVPLHFFVVVGHGAEQVKEHFAKDWPQLAVAQKLTFIEQREQLGTGHALQLVALYLPQSAHTIVACGDTPLLTTDVLLSLYQQGKNCGLPAMVSTFHLEQPTGYGRIVPGTDQERGSLQIVEEKDATPEQRNIKEVNAGLYYFQTDFLKQQLPQLTTSKITGEIYLTELFRPTVKAATLKWSTAEVFLGVNDQSQASTAEQLLKRRLMQQLRSQGVYIADELTTDIHWQVSIASGCRIYGGTHLWGKTIIEGHCELGPQVVIQDCYLHQGAKVLPFSHLEGAQVKQAAQIGPFARLRPGADIGAQAKIGNFVEIKKSQLGTGVKVSHLSYVGDAQIGDHSNIGCGFITCNYDGRQKHQTQIGEGTFIGSDCQVIAPITIGDHCYVAAGSTINQSIPSGGFAIARTRQETKPGRAAYFLPKADSSDKT